MILKYVCALKPNPKAGTKRLFGEEGWAGDQAQDTSPMDPAWL